MTRVTMSLCGAAILLAGCGSEPAVTFKNTKTGEVQTACGPLYGLTYAISEAHNGCIDSYKEEGWVVQQ